MNKQCKCVIMNGTEKLCSCSFDLSPDCGLNEKPKCVICGHQADVKKRNFTYVSDDGNEFPCFPKYVEQGVMTS